MKSNISFGYLRKFNLTMGFLHLIQGILMLWLGLSLDNIKDFRLPINISFLKFDPFLKKLVLETDQLTTLPIAAFLSSFLFISALAHFVIVYKQNKYEKDLKNGINVFRWFEYAISSSIMIILIAMLFGVYDVSTLVMILGANATMNLLGLQMELSNQGRDKVQWSPFVIGSFIGIFPWIVILIAFLGNGDYDKIPGFVYGALGAYFFFFNLFPINMYLQYKKIGKWSDYLYGERGYIILSLVAKSILAWLVFGGTLQP